MKILIIEDEIALAESITAYLSKEGYLCENITSYSEGLSKIFDYKYDCILLDLMLPGGNGLELLEAFRRENKNEGVIIISAKDRVEDKIKGLQLGADDYLSKPFHLSELSARIYSLMRRKNFENTNILQYNELQINLMSKSVLVDKKSIKITKKEYQLLLFLIGNKNRVISKGSIAEHLSGDMADMLDNHDFVYTHINNLKKKLSRAGGEDYIKSIYGMGYKWEL
ncbi:response regulator transcription factor [Aequorivita sp. CIP111184]|uniref:response regulator transcription factor n=1 Tax=Aequorivita sp. CIP111184 TaxID=2211356 RepID=UPI000DBBFD12|nr:response regulator transcription factor [Aequorivita sp. CIP111184]SRX53865.1 Transcriptional regulatory protein QseB [Aequorivita sp. CIP111184]